MARILAEALEGETIKVIYALINDIERFTDEETYTILNVSSVEVDDNSYIIEETDETITVLPIRNVVSLEIKRGE